MELLQYWKIVSKYLWLIILLMVLAGLSATYYASQKTPLYLSTTTLFINPGQVSPMVPGQTESRGVSALASTYTELLRTRSFVNQVAEKMEASVSPGEVRGAINSSYVDGTQFFRISAIHPDAAVAQELANTTAEVLISSEIQRQQSQQQQIEMQQNQRVAAGREELEELIRSLETELAYYNDRVTTTQQQVVEIQDSLEPGEESPRLERLIESLPELRYARIDVQTRLANAELDLASLSTNVEPSIDTAVVVDEALLPGAPLPRQIPQTVMLAVGFALIMGVALAFVFEYLDYTIKTPEEMDTTYGMPVMGVIGATSQRDLKKQNNQKLVALFKSNSPIAESFRAIRTGIQVTSMNTTLRSILVTSAGPGEGKTFVAANLAATLALSGNRVILVDSDLRKPRLHHLFDVPRGSGFTNLVVNQENSLVDKLQPTAINNLQLLTCGTVPPNPTELLSSMRAEALMMQLEELADIVVYDSPPAATVTDAAILAPRVDGVIQVVWAGHTRTNLVLRCKAVLEQVGAHMLGPVLNKVNISDLGYYSYYYYYGYYQDSGQNAGRSALGRMLPITRRSRANRNGKSRAILESANGSHTGSVNGTQTDHSTESAVDVQEPDEAHDSDTRDINGVPRPEDNNTARGE